MAAGKKIRFVVITPERRVLEETTDFLVFTAHDGEIGVLPKRAPLMCELGIGQLRYEAGAETRRLFIDGGFAQVQDNHVTVLSQHAVPAEDISPQMVAEAERAVSELHAGDPETVGARLQAQQRLSALRRLHE
jgi:F-type H+-transporting ATPase subunit epsilon